MGFNPVWASSGEFKEIEFLWYPFIQKGNLNMLTGEPGSGKSTIICDIAAALSVGRRLPHETNDEAERHNPGVVKTLILNAEDGFEDTIKWRLRNQGADMDKIAIVTDGEKIDEAYIKDVFNFIREHDIGLLVVDPIQAWTGSELDIHRANHTRAWTNLFKALPTTTLFCRHMRKGNADDQNTINSGLGSIDLTGAVRSEIRARVNKGADTRVLERIKGNVGPMRKLTYSIKGTEDPRNVHGQLSWSGEIIQTKEKARSEPTETKSDRLVIGAVTASPGISRIELVKNLVTSGKMSLATLDRALNKHAYASTTFPEGKRHTTYRILELPWGPKATSELDEQRTDDPETEAA